jgi:nitroimidazol reductase NimA-like FMN-containing flavoprotein (pyridoxamine 5'-phosphate oxidase superfamily)
VRRVPQRAAYEREAIEAILDEALVSHLGVIDPAGFPVVIPTLHARVGEHVYVHGSAASRTLREAGRADACLTVTQLDGLVLARSAFHHSVNYRSVIVFGRAEQIEAGEDKERALRAFTEKLVPGRWPDVRPPTEQELRGTSVMRIALDEAAAKIRSGPPVDDEPDYELPVWAGTVGLRLVRGEPRPDARLAPGVGRPEYLDESATSSR